MKTLIAATDLLTACHGSHPPLLLDCSFDLADPSAGERAWQAGHPPGSQYVHLDRDLAGPLRDAAGRFLGRHPLPAREAFAATLGRLGIGPDTTVVCYDAQGGPYAARCWWMLRWMGHADVAVLDGGLAAWREAAGTMTAEALPTHPRSAYPLRPPAMPIVDADTLAARLGRLPLVDARPPERFRGEVEPLDAAAGHIPGAHSRFFKSNLAADGRFKPADALRAEWLPLLAGREARDVVQQCGSGVTACHNLLALAHAGLGDSMLYPGSWSEWSADPKRPQARG
ncbi:MAG: sulfurtransferase [Burkholderiaceae bacterium]